ncbi:MAG TPA: membrane dipeptidase [Syntrophobacteraceae bacterium]|nr:membrane dipeptidase [Syntrophobacteraceae bacterium]
MDLHSVPPSFPIVDGHVDVLFEMMEHHSGRRFSEISSGTVTLDLLKRGNVRIIVSALYCADQYNGEESAAGRFQQLVRYARDHLDGVVPIGSSRELQSVYESPEHEPAVLFLLENADALVDMDLTALDPLRIRVVGLTHMGSNRIGDGNGVFFPEGLRREGKEVVRKLKDAGCGVDVAHLSDPCFWDLMDLFEGPVLSSHTGFRFFCNIPRNLNRDQVRVLVERRGIIGISVSPDMLALDGVAKAEDVFRHIDWVTQSFGPEFVALGSDFCGFFSATEGVEDISRLSGLAERMTRDGYPSEAVQGIMGNNWVRFYSALL